MKLRPGGQHETLLGARVGHVDAPIVMEQLDRTEGRYGVDHEKGRMAGSIDGCPNARNITHHPCGGLVVDHKNRLDLVTPIRTEVFFQGGGVDRPPPIRRQNVDREPHGAGHCPPGLDEMTVVVAHDPVTGRQRVHKRRLPRSAS